MPLTDLAKDLEDDFDSDDEPVTKKSKPEIEEIKPKKYLPAVYGCRSVEEFEINNKIEEGTYGVVYRAREKKGKREMVALKKLKMDREREGFPITSLREVNTLR